MWLFSQGRSNQYSMMKDSKSAISGQKWTELANRLDELIEWGIIEKKQSEDAANVKVFFLTKRGQEFASAIIGWKDKFPELLNFESFVGVKQVD